MGGVGIGWDGDQLGFDGTGWSRWDEVGLMEWDGMGWGGMRWDGVSLRRTGCDGMLVWRGVVWSSVVRCSEIWCGMVGVRCGVALYGMCWVRLDVRAERCTRMLELKL